MKLIFLIIICATFVASCLAQDEALIFSNNKVSGTMLDDKSQPVAKIRVCLYPTHRPQQGRAPCAMTDEQGKYNFIAYIIIGEKYAVSASTEWTLIRKGKFPKKPQETWSEPIIFSTKDESKEVNLKFKEKIKLK